MGLEVIRAIQRFSNPALDVVMECLTLFGEQMILAAVFCWIYWCLDKRLGRYLAVALGLSVCLNGAVKDFFKVERMFGEPGIISRRVETATGYSFPSGHSQTAAAFWGGVALAAKTTRLRAALIVLTLLVGFSRMYLGVHYPADVVGGLALGFGCAAAAYILIYRGDKWRDIAAICALVIVFAAIAAESEDTFKAFGMLAGILAGIAFEQKFVKFETAKLRLSRAARRYFPGMALVGALYIVPKLLLPDSTLTDALRYGFTVFAATGLWPYLFNKLKW